MLPALLATTAGLLWLWWPRLRLLRWHPATLPAATAVLLGAVLAESLWLGRVVPIATAVRVEVPHLALRAPVGGPVAEVLAKVGDELSAEQPIYRLDRSALESTAERLTTDLASVRSEREELGQEVERLRTNLTDAERLVAQGLMAREELTLLRGRIDRLGSKSARLDQRIDSLARSLASAHTGLDRPDARSPAPGRLLRLSVSKGMAVSANDEVGSIAVGEPTISALVAQLSAARIRPGDPAQLLIDPMPAEAIDAEVVAIAWGNESSELSPQAPSHVPIRLRLTSTDTALLPGMRGLALIRTSDAGSLASLLQALELYARSLWRAILAGL